MTTLTKCSSGEVWLTLRGEAEDRILAALRHWPYWLRADIERDPANPKRCLSVTLVANEVHEPVMRDVLKRSFDMTFPEAGGEVALPPVPVPVRKRGWSR